MTLIASLAADGHPTLFGDLLLTGPTANTAPNVSIPALGNVSNFFGNSGWVVSRLAQKICLVSDRLVVAWSGSWLGASLVLAELRRRDALGLLSYSDIFEYLNGEEELALHPASFIGLISEKDGIRRFHFHAEELDSQSHGKLFYAGTGACIFKDLTESVISSDACAVGPDNPILTALSANLFFGAALLQTEYLQGDAATTIRNMFGGGYEIAHYDYRLRRFEKIAPITYILWTVDCTDGSVHVGLPRLIVAQHYSGEFLLIRSLRFDPSTVSQAPLNVDERRFVIAPMIASEQMPTVARIADIHIESSTYCHCIAVHVAGKSIGIGTIISQNVSPADQSFRLEFHDGKVKFSTREV
ncbi:hypothetical protein PROAA_1090013 [Candidatus Propionivibrio aalborgensis]|uniref:Uncharacterized protein n=1 Tax=Candidatus Propionivibrio aalborgensis TaxID=1860101 RepID=A0A1A8XEU2_9RHOO|nr:hypothetical protein [Candidatus Propionivibrio aalborgensis]SBT03695.1 hypothetical protein PROAA_1090013 [Candidatus Propionivibrio aalborgensis]